jgi:hypothetical protein
VCSMIFRDFLYPQLAVFAPIIILVALHSAAKNWGESVEMEVGHTGTVGEERN